LINCETLGRATGLSGVLLPLTLGVLACGSTEIESFTAEPRRACAGDTVEVRWRATGDARLTSDPALPAAEVTAPSDTLHIALKERTLFRLSAVNGQDYAEQEVVIYDGGRQDTLSGSTSPVGDSALVAMFDVPEAVWTDILRIESARSLSNRPLTVRHEGREAVIPADTVASDGLKGMTVGGNWELRAPLVEGEVMGDPDKPPPAHLLLLVNLECQR